MVFSYTWNWFKRKQKNLRLCCFNQIDGAGQLLWCTIPPCSFLLRGVSEKPCSHADLPLQTALLLPPQHFLFLVFFLLVWIISSLGRSSLFLLTGIGTGNIWTNPTAPPIMLLLTHRRSFTGHYMTFTVDKYVSDVLHETFTSSSSIHLCLLLNGAGLPQWYLRSNPVW